MKTRQLLRTGGIALMLLVGLPSMISAQRAVNLTEVVSISESNPSKVRYYAPCITNNMYVSVGAGTQTLIAEHLGKTRYTLALNAAVGKWFTPNLGIRLNVLGGNLQNHWEPDNMLRKIDYFGVYGDLTWNLMNTFAGYNESRLFSIIPFAGIGYNYIYKTNEGKRTYTFPISAGLKLNFRLSHYVDLFIEGRANVLSDQFNSVVQDVMVESIVSAVGGISINLGHDRFVGYNAGACQAAISSLNNQVNAMRSQLEECMDRECPPCPEVEVTEAVIVETPVCNKDLTAVVRFNINSASVSNEEMVNVYNIAKWMDENPSCNVEIVGYADKGTGSAAYNMKLSQKRANAVIKVLTEKYKINKNRIQMVAKGSSEQLYPENNNWNRVVVFYGKAAQ